MLVGHDDERRVRNLCCWEDTESVMTGSYQAASVSIVARELAFAIALLNFQLAWTL